MDLFRGTYGIYLNVMKDTRKITIFNRLDLETLGIWSIMPKNLPGHSIGLVGKP